MKLELEQVDAGALSRARDGVAALVRDVVEGGWSVGFVLPFADGELDAYVDGVVADVRAGSRVVVLARDGDRVAGMVQLELTTKSNARHRAEVQKLLVHNEFRRQGLARRLMDEIERIARSQGRTLLVLDTEQGSPAEALYRSSGYVEVGSVPGYAARAHGGMIATVIFFKRLD